MIIPCPVVTILQISMFLYVHENFMHGLDPQIAQMNTIAVKDKLYIMNTINYIGLLRLIVCRDIIIKKSISKKIIFSKVYGKGIVTLLLT